jgi:hypothetical protein
MLRYRTMFLTLSACVALAVGSLALSFPETLLETKGVALPNQAAAVWVREVGVTIVALGVLMFLVRKHDDSPTLRAVLLGNAIVQLGLLPIEIRAYQQGVLGLVSGVIPNSALHLALFAGFVFFAMRIRAPGQCEAS